MHITVSGIEVELIRKNIKNMHLYVLRPNGEVRITAPLKLSEKRITEFIESKADWIAKQRKKIEDEPKEAPITYSNGDTLIIFGKHYVLEVIEGKKSDFFFFLGKATLICKASSTVEEREKIIEKALRVSLNEKIPPILAKWESITNLKASSFQIKKMKTRWGTCNTRTKKIWLNLELCRKSDECIEYVILHELTHLLVPNHGKDFSNFMDRYMPRWKEIRKALNER